MTLEERVHALAKKYQIRPRREQGQHFVIEEDVLETMVTASELTKNDTVIEIGPGFGTLTMVLAEHAGSVIAIEQDRTLIKSVEALKTSYPNIHPVLADARKANIGELVAQYGAGKSYKLVSNLPYNITSWVLRQYLEHEPRPARVTLLIQKEVAERAAASPGAMSMLSVAVQLFSAPRIVKGVSPDCFWPEPEVQSAIITLEHIQSPSDTDPAAVLRLAKMGYASKRKQLRKNLSAGLRRPDADILTAFKKIGLLPTARAQELSIAEWKALAAIFA